MEKTKYGKYIMKATAEKNAPPVVVGKAIGLEGLKDWGGIQHRLKWTFVTSPIVMVDEPHSHDCDEFLIFLGGDAANGRDFGAEVELSLGLEGEKQIIDGATVVCIPKGMVHCPINFKKIGKPIMFCRIYTSPEHARKPAKK